jgi:hypothetical protein
VNKSHSLSTRECLLYPATDHLLGSVVDELLVPLKSKVLGYMRGFSIYLAPLISPFYFLPFLFLSHELIHRDKDTTGLANFETLTLTTERDNEVVAGR